MGLARIIELAAAIIMSLGVLGGGALVCVKTIAFFTEMRLNVRSLMNNHLPHIQMELEGLRKDFDTMLKRLGGLDG